MAVKTSQPSFASSVSAVRRMVLLSSITRTFSPVSFVLLPVTVRRLLAQNGVDGPRGPRRPRAHVAGFVPRNQLGARPRRTPSTHQPSSLTGPLQRGKRCAVLTYRYTPCYAMRVTFFERRPSFQRLASPGQDIFALP